MSDKRYPTRMHEVLGVEPEERFMYSDYGDREFWLSESGLLYGAYDDGKVMSAVTQGTLVLFINNPERITRRPRLTEEQVRVLEALYEVFDFKWLAKQKDGQVMAYANRPNKSEDWYGCWFSGEGDNEEDYGWKVKDGSPVWGLISWYDPAPLDIVQVLRQNGCDIGEVEP